MRRGLFVLLAAAPLAAASEAPRRTGNALLSAPAPTEWSVRSSTPEIAFVRAPDKDAPAATILLVYRRPGANEPADAAAYAARRLSRDDLFGTESEYTREKDVRVAGRTCPVISRRAPDPDPHAKKRPMMAERVVVVPAAAGYYLLSVYGPESRRAEDLKAFQRVLAGFKPAL